MLIYIHKEQMLDAVAERYPVRHYVMVIADLVNCNLPFVPGAIAPRVIAPSKTEPRAAPKPRAEPQGQPKENT